MDILTPILVSTVIMGLTPFVAFITQKYVEQGRRMRVFNRLQNEKLFKVGTVVSELQLTGRDKPIFPGECTVTALEPGRVEFNSSVGLIGTTGFISKTVVFTGREVEELIIVLKDEIVNE